MNDPVVLTGIGILLCAIVFGLYIRWRRAPRKGFSRPIPPGWLERQENGDWVPIVSGKKPSPTTSAGILAGLVRPPIREIQHMFGVYLLLGITLAALSLFLRLDVEKTGNQWISYPFLGLGLAMVAAGSYWGSRLDRASRFERAASFLAYRLGTGLLRMICLANAAVFLILAVIARGMDNRQAGPMIAGISSVSGVVLLIIGIRRSRFSKLPA